MTKLKGFSSFHNFQHEDKGIRIWKAFSVGSGRFIPHSNIFLQHQGPTNLKVEEDQDFFPEVSGRSFKTKQDKTSYPEVQIYECSEPGCCQEFDSMEDLDVHMELGVHEIVHPNESIYDQLRRQWAAQFGNVTVHKSNTEPISGDNTIHSEGESDCPSSALPMGWALHAPASKSRFPDCVKLYLKAKFDLGERTGEKADSQQVALDMRNARNEDGDRLFQRDQWLTKNQVKGFFSRLAVARRKNVGTNDSEDDLVSLSEIDDVSGNQWMEELESLQEEQERCSLLEAVESQMGVTHPIIFDTYDLCECNEQNRLNVFKIVMLKEICSTFDIAFKSRETKGMLLAKLKEMLDQCSCSI
jgi:Arf-GAP/Rho-GAP domain/ANK repeat/PH domain-containing protein 3